MCAAIGIDLGDTFCRVSVWDKDHPEIIPNDQGNRATPSCIAFTDTQVLVGDAAKNQASANSSNTVFGILGLLGHRFSDPKLQEDINYWPFRVIGKAGDKPYVRVIYKGVEQDFSPTKLCSILLTKMKESAEAFIGKHVKNAVVSIPTNFTFQQRRALVKAGTLAGLNILRFIQGSSVASLACHISPSEKLEHILIFDLGGRSLSVSLIVLQDGFHQVKATAVNMNLGGWDFDKRIMAHFVDKFKRQFGKDISRNSQAICRLHKACESAKMTLSSSTMAFIELDNLFEGHNFHTTITKETFEYLCLDLFHACLDPVYRVLQENHYFQHQVDEIVLVGGSSKIPKIVQLLKDVFSGKPAVIKLANTEAIANGTGIQAAKLTGCGNKLVEHTLLLDVAPVTLGIENEQGKMVPIINRNSTIPCKQAQIFSIHPNTQHSIIVKVYEGEYSNTMENNLLGILGLPGIPLTSKDSAQVEVTFTISCPEILHISAEELSTKTTCHLTINLRAESMQVQELKQEYDQSKKKEADSLCVICEDKPINVVLVPCGHLIMCEDCSSQLEKQRSNVCPSCRSNVTTRVKTFRR